MADENKNKNLNKPENKESNNPFSNLGGKGNGKKPKFNFYWIYGLLAVAFIAIQFLNWGDGAKQTDWKDLKQMLEDGDLEKITLVNKEYAEIYIKPDKLNSEKYKDLEKNESLWGKKNPQYYYNVASPEVFIDQVSDAQKESENPIYVETETRIKTLSVADIRR